MEEDINFAEKELSLIFLLRTFVKLSSRRSGHLAKIVEELD